MTDPNVAYLLFVLGLLAVVTELYHPGALLPGALGVVALVLAVVTFGTLGIGWPGVLLVVGAFALFIGELHTGVGALAIGAVVALVAGSLLLHASPWLVGVASAVASAFFLVVVRATLRSRRIAVRTGIAAMIGQSGVAISELGPTGTVRVDGESWSAEVESGTIHAGERVTVVGASGVTLHVARAAPFEVTNEPYRGAGRGAASWNHPSPSTSS